MFIEKCIYLYHFFCQVISELQFGLQSDVEPEKSQQQITITSCMEGTFFITICLVCVSMQRPFIDCFLIILYTDNCISTLFLDITECDISTESELQLSLEWRELEKRLNEEEEQKLAAQEIERELHLNSEREEEERRRKRLMEFEEELKKVEKVRHFRHL